MNHLYHSLSPLILLTSFTLLVVTFISPTSIFNERVSLIKISIGERAASSVSKRAIEVTPIVAAASHRFIRHSKHLLGRASSPVGLSSPTYTLFYGPMGLCYRIEKTKTVSCSAPSFTPLFGEQYDKLALSTAQQALLPEQFPLAPAAIFLSLILAALALVSLLLSSLAMHAPKKLAFLGGQRQIKLRNAALVTAIISAVGGLAACGSFHVDLGRAVNRWLEAGGKASLGTGLTQFYAAYALELISILMLLAETFTSR